MTAKSDQGPREPDDGLDRGERVAAGVVALVLLGLGVLATLESPNDLASAALTITGALFAYLAISGSAIRSWSVGGNEMNLSRRQRIRGARDVQVELAESTTEVQEERAAFEALEYEDVLPPEVRVAASRLRSRSRHKAEVVTEIATESELADPGLGVGSSVSSRFFGELAIRWAVPAAASMPDIAQAIVEKSGGQWDRTCFSTGSTVTLVGLERLLAAVRRLRAAEAGMP